MGCGVGEGVGPGVIPPPPLPDGDPILGSVGIGKKIGGNVKITGAGVGEGREGTFVLIMVLGALGTLAMLLVPLPPLPFPLLSFAALPGAKKREVSE